jgi:hypothetical protein
MLALDYGDYGSKVNRANALGLHDSRKMFNYKFVRRGCRRVGARKWPLDGRPAAWKLNQSQQDAEEQQPAAHVRRHQEVFFDVFAAVLAQLLCEVRMRQQVPNLVSATLN